MLDGIAGGSLIPDNDIVAGCFSATYALQAYLVDELRAQATAHPEVGLAVHVGDISQEVVANNSAECVDLMVEAARGLKSALHDELEMQVADAKGTILGNSDALANLGLPKAEMAGQQAPSRAARGRAARPAHRVIPAAVRHRGLTSVQADAAMELYSAGSTPGPVRGNNGR